MGWIERRTDDAQRSRGCHLGAGHHTATSLCALTVSFLSLAQTASAGPAVGWRMNGTGIFPNAQPSVEWSATRNVAWATPMPGWSNSSPILVGNRVLVSAEPDLLVSLSAADGRILWQQASPVEAATPEPVEPSGFGRRASEIEQVQSLLRQADLELTEARRLVDRTTDDTDAPVVARSRFRESDRLRQRLAALAASSPPHPSDANGLATPTPTSDGESVFVLFGTGVVASYDLDGRRRWITFVDRPLDRDGMAASPVIAGDTIVVLINDLVALDRTTGRLRWRASVPPRSGTPAAFRIEDRDFVITPSGHSVRVSDGAVVASALGDLDYASPLVQDGVLYMIQQTARAFRIPKRIEEPLEFEPLWTTRMKGERYYSSPLVVDGLLYAITRGQILNVIDAGTGEAVYAQRLRLGWTGAADSVFTSPTFAGQHVFVSGLSGTTVVLKPGRRYEQQATNELEMLRSNPIFAGDRMYVRGLTKMYCIASAPPLAAETGRRP